MKHEHDAGAGGTALARCVACPAHVFAEENWGRTPRLTRAADLPAGFDDLLNAAAVDELVSERGLRTPFLRMAKEGAVLPSARFTRGGGAGAGIADQAADDRVLVRMADGATLVLQALHRSWPPLVDFGSRLAAELGHPVQINAYITPPENQGFAPHYDVHDVFVLQVAGRKTWTIHQPVVTDPLDNQPWDRRRDEVEARAAGQPVIDTVLEPGDALYLPRGTIHAAQALGEASIHITIGVHPLTRNQLVRYLLDEMQDVAELRASLPMGSDLADPAVLAPHLAATVDALRARLGEVSVQLVAERVGTHLMQRTRPEAIGPLAQLAAAEAVQPDSRLRLRGALRLRVDKSDDHVRLIMLDRTIKLPAASADAIKTVVSGSDFTPAELTGLDAGEQVTLARRLIREGVLVAHA